MFTMLNLLSTPQRGEQQIQTENTYVHYLEVLLHTVYIKLKPIMLLILPIILPKIRIFHNFHPLLFIPMLSPIILY